MSYFNLKFRVDFLEHVKNVIINILFFTVYISELYRLRCYRFAAQVAAGFRIRDMSSLLYDLKLLLRILYLSTR